MLQYIYQRTLSEGSWYVVQKILFLPFYHAKRKKLYDGAMTTGSFSDTNASQEKHSKTDEGSNKEHFCETSQ